MKIKVKMNQTAVLKAIARKNLSQNAIALKAGMSSGYFSQLMRRVRYPSPLARQKILKALETQKK